MLPITGRICARNPISLCTYKLTFSNKELAQEIDDPSVEITEKKCRDIL
jgi:hypothetical protein